MAAITAFVSLTDHRGGGHGIDPNGNELLFDSVIGVESRSSKWPLWPLTRAGLTGMLGAEAFDLRRSQPTSRG